MRIRIEQSFGMLVNKFWGFKIPLECRLSQAPLIINTATHIHNFCVDENLYDDMKNIPDPYLHEPEYDVYVDDDGSDPLSSRSAEWIDTSETRRDSIRRLLQQHGVIQPIHDRECNELILN